MTNLTKPSKIVQGPWAQSDLPAEIRNSRRSPGCEEIAPELQEAMASQGGFVCSLGWSQTYDRMGSEAICAVLTSFCRLMERAWIHRQWISCYEDVSQDPHSSKMSLCSGSHGGHDCFWLDLGWAWGALSPAESICMIVLSTPLRGRTRRLALGVTLLTGPRKYAAAEAPRIQKALKRAAVLQSSQLFWHLLAMARAYQYFVISACSCGWAVYLPSLTTNKQLLRMFGPVAGFQQRMASLPLRQILLGGHLYLHLRSVSSLVRRHECCSKAELPGTNRAATIAGPLRRFLESEGCITAGPCKLSFCA